ncbi:MAG: TetR/AcrR family transcriptional regulator [Spirochaetales bacterium]|nr:TetR/AcrR family transcriptional regulator [Spirochaetales bacterium]
MTENREKTSRQEQAEESKKKIYQVAVDLIAEKGFDKTSITEICRKAECSVGAFYHYFPTKQSILEEVFYVADARFSGWDRFDEQCSNCREQIVSYMKAYAEFVSMESGLEFSKRFYNTGNKIFIRKGRAMQERLVELLRKSLESGQIKMEMTPEKACEWLFMGARGVVFHWCLHEGDFDLIEKMEDYTRIALRGLQA